VVDDSRAAPLHARFCILLGLIALIFAAQSVHLARVLVPSHDETSALFFGYLTASGRVSLYQDEVIGHRAPGPAYIIGSTQVMWGRSLMAARLASVTFALALLLLTAGLAREVGGDTAGLLAAAFLTAQGAIVGYYAIVPMVMALIVSTTRLQTARWVISTYP
jgi:4-amino-4-deoxy-L-arabinose transferase-like glycosyltransferase